MGAAASLSAVGLPERMNRADVQQLCDNRYTEAQFVSICDAEGYITRQQFVEQVVLEQEEECRRLFVSFCRHDAKGRNSEEMDEEHLISFLRHCKLLSKSQFSIHDARTLFHQMIQEKVDAQDETNVHVVNEMDAQGEVQQHVYISYSMFRQQLLPVLAQKKNLEMDRVMFLLSRCEANTRLVKGELVVTDTYDPADKDEKSVERHVQLLVNEKEEEEKEKKRKQSLPCVEVPPSLAQVKASTVIQGAARKRNAKRRRENMKLIRHESSRMIDDTCFCNEVYDEDLEARFKAKYAAFAPPRSGEMDFRHFHRWLFHCGWYISHKNFTKGDADVAFKKAMARASVLSAGIDINMGVIMNKRVRYIAFRQAVVKVLAEEINVNTNDVMYLLLDVDDPE